jgi:type II secretory pathway pseudopilin PulG
MAVYAVRTTMTPRGRRKGDDAMTTKEIIVIIFTILSSLGVSWAQTSVRLQDVDTRERINAQSAERAIERVSKEASDRVVAAENEVSVKLDKIDKDVQWLIKEISQTSAVVNRLEKKIDR